MPVRLSDIAAPVPKQLRLSDILGPTAEPTVPAQVSHPAGVPGITRSDIDIPQDRLGSSYWWLRGPAFAESQAMGAVQTLPVAAKEVYGGEKVRLADIIKPEPFPIRKAMQMVRSTPGFNKAFNKNVMEPINYLIDRLDPAKYGYLTPKVNTERVLRRQENYDRGFLKGLGNDLVEGGADLGMLFASMAAVRKIPALKRPMIKDLATLEKAISKGRTLTPKLQTYRTLLRGIQNSGAFATHGFLSTPGTMEDRVKAATARFAYTFTPHIVGLSRVNEIFAGGVGAWLTPRVVDSLLNMTISTPQYAEAIKAAREPGGEFTFTQKLISAALPVFLTDVLYSLRTTGYPHYKAIQIDGKVWAAHKKAGMTQEPKADYLKRMSKFRAKFEQALIQKQMKLEGKLKEVKPEKQALPPMKDSVTATQTAREQTGRVRSEKLNVGIAGGKEQVKFDELPPEIQRAILKNTDDALSRGVGRNSTEMQNVIKSTMEEMFPNRIYWMGGDPEHHEHGKFFFEGERGEGNSTRVKLDRVIDIAFDRKLADLNDLGFVGSHSNYRDLPGLMKETFDRRRNIRKRVPAPDKVEVPDVKIDVDKDRQALEEMPVEKAVDTVVKGLEAPTKAQDLVHGEGASWSLLSGNKVFAGGVFTNKPKSWQNLFWALSPKGEKVSMMEALGREKIRLSDLWHERESHKFAIETAIKELESVGYKITEQTPQGKAVYKSKPTKPAEKLPPGVRDTYNNKPFHTLNADENIEAVSTRVKPI